MLPPSPVAQAADTPGSAAHADRASNEGDGDVYMVDEEAGPGVWEVGSSDAFPSQPLYMSWQEVRRWVSRPRRDTHGDTCSNMNATY